MKTFKHHNLSTTPFKTKQYKNELKPTLNQFWSLVLFWRNSNCLLYRVLL